MVVFGWIAVVMGSVLFITSLIRTVQANPETRIPFNRNPPVVPAGSIAMRSIGAGLLIFGIAALTATFASWSVLLVLIMLVVPLAVVVNHNRRLPVESNR